MSVLENAVGNLTDTWRGIGEATAVATNPGPAFETLALAVGGIAVRVDAVGGNIDDVAVAEVESGEDPQSQWAAQGFGDALASVFVGGRWTLTCDTRPHAHIGLGGACPSAAAGALAANSILTRLGRAPSLDGLCGVVAEVERRAHGLARPGAARAALVGGMGATTRLHPPRAVSLRPPRFWMVCVAPEVDVTQLDHKSVSMGQIHVMKHVRQSARSQGLLLALQASDAHGARDCFEDALIEPTLGKLIPGVYPALHAAREAGAIGAWVSGGGPVTCALASEEEAATEIRDAIVHAYLAHRIESNATIARLAPTRHTLHGWPHG